MLLHACKWISHTPGLVTYLPFNTELPPITQQGLYLLAPVSLIGITGIVFNTLCLEIVDASFFQV